MVIRNLFLKTAAAVNWKNIHYILARPSPGFSLGKMNSADLLKQLVVCCTDCLGGAGMSKCEVQTKPQIYIVWNLFFPLSGLFLSKTELAQEKLARYK